MKSNNDNTSKPNYFTIVLCSVNDLGSYWSSARLRLGLATAFIEKGPKAKQVPAMIDDEIDFVSSRSDQEYTILIDASSFENCEYVMHLLDEGVIDEIQLRSEFEDAKFEGKEHFTKWLEEAKAITADMLSQG